MIIDPKSAHFIQWTEHGSRCVRWRYLMSGQCLTCCRSFVVSNVGEFSRTILGTHFKHNNVNKLFHSTGDCALMKRIFFSSLASFGSSICTGSIRSIGYADSSFPFYTLLNVFFFLHRLHEHRERQRMRKPGSFHTRDSSGGVLICLKRSNARPSNQIRRLSTASSSRARSRRNSDRCVNRHGSSRVLWKRNG